MGDISANGDTYAALLTINLRRTRDKTEYLQYLLLQFQVSDG